MNGSILANLRRMPDRDSALKHYRELDSNYDANCWRFLYSVRYLFFVLALGGCVSLPQTEALREAGYPGLPPRAELVEVPYYAQEDLMCGPTSLAMALNGVGIEANIATLTEQVYLPGRQGSLQIEMLAATRRNRALAYQLAPELRAVLQEVAAGTPVVALLNLSGIKFWPIWHYAVVVGYDLEREEIIVRSGPNPRRVTDLGFFEFLWKDGGYWAMAAVPPNRVPATAEENPYAAAAAALELAGHRREAGESYRALLARWPQNLVGLIGLGNVEYSRGNLAAAEAAFRHARPSRLAASRSPPPSRRLPRSPRGAPESGAKPRRPA